MNAMMSGGRLHPGVLDLDCEAEAKRIGAGMIEILGKKLRRRGVVIGLSGGIDSSACAALSVKALGPERVFGVLMPERDSSRASVELGQKLAKKLGIQHLIVDLTAALEALGCYRERDEAIREVFADYGPGWKNKIVITGGTNQGMNFFRLVVQDPSGRTAEKRLPLASYLRIVAAQNYKQRLRKTVEFFHADRLNYAVIGTPNRLEYDQGFFVKNGDGSADLKPIAHLYKTQVYAIAKHLGVPEEITSSRPTTDTYSLPQSQDEFYFALPYEKMDVALWALNHGVSEADLGTALGMTAEQAGLVYKDIRMKRVGTAPLHAKPLLIEPVAELPTLS